MRLCHGLPCRVHTQTHPKLRRRLSPIANGLDTVFGCSLAPQKYYIIYCIYALDAGARARWPASVHRSHIGWPGRNRPIELIANNHNFPPRMVCAADAPQQTQTRARARVNVRGYSLSHYNSVRPRIRGLPKFKTH